MLLSITVLERILYLDAPNLRHLLKYFKRHKVQTFKLTLYLMNLKKKQSLK